MQHDAYMEPPSNKAYQVLRQSKVYASDCACMAWMHMDLQSKPSRNHDSVPSAIYVYSKHYTKISVVTILKSSKLLSRLAWYTESAEQVHGMEKPWHFWPNSHCDYGRRRPGITLGGCFSSLKFLCQSNEKREAMELVGNLSTCPRSSCPRSFCNLQATFDCYLDAQQRYFKW